MKQLHSGAKWIFRVRTYFSLLFLIFIFGSFFIPFVMSNSDSPSFYFAFVFSFSGIILAVAFGEIYSKFAYKNWKYELTSREVKLEHGIIWKKYSAIPFERVQNIDICRGILARMLGFSTLNIQTAGYHMASQGGMVSEGYIPAVSVKEAENIREFLIKKIGKRQGL
ncbi:PH domain-containing protein [Candidatus Pacearchaeota archaeon]|jgi:membrane protein YdbS with pleckstrin-like domain|nr:PH domain-containing protein [Candidatus Pacearchaeota archaeon]